MEVFLAGRIPQYTKGHYDAVFARFRPYYLQSYYYLRGREPLYKNVSLRIIDSGAFSFFFSGRQMPAWEEYTDEYADFVAKIGAERYVEMDVDRIVGYSKVLELRRRLERKVGAPPIIVYHKGHGKEAFIEACKHYPRVAIGTTARAGEWSNAELEQFLPYAIQTAHRHGAKIHGLGFTRLSSIARLHFDSVDSSSFLMGNRNGTVYHFADGKLTHSGPPAGCRIKDHYALARHNLTEWCKFQAWARNHL